MCAFDTLLLSFILSACRGLSTASHGQVDRVGPPSARCLVRFAMRARVLYNGTASERLRWENSRRLSAFALDHQPMCFELEVQGERRKLQAHEMQSQLVEFG